MSNIRPARLVAALVQTESRRLWPGTYWIAFGYFLVHMLLSTRYGIFRDAMYLLDCARHLAWGFVDQPPLFPFIAWIAIHTFGTSLPALIFWPALAGVLRIVLTAAFARQLGAGTFGQAFAALLSATTSGWLIIDHQFSMNAFDPLFWAGSAFVILRLIQTGDLRLWLAFGLLSGLGLENKYSMAAFALALLLGVLLTPQRRILFTPWFLAGGAVAFVIALPNLIWEIANQWPFLQFLHNVSATGKDVILSPVAFLGRQLLIMGPPSFPFWFAGLLYLLFSKRTKPYRALGLAFLFTLVIFEVTHGKDYYPLPVYPIVIAAAGLALERWLATPWFTAHSAARRIAAPAFALWILIPLSFLLPLVLPVLPIDQFLAYQQHLPFGIPRSETAQIGASLPQYYADEFGWEQMVQAVARVYHSLTPEEQKKAAILTSNYGQAGAIDYFGPKYGLPPAISGHNSFWLWGPRDYTGEVVIRVGDRLERAQQHFDSVTVAATLDNPYTLFYEKRPILLCRHLKQSLQSIWPDQKSWD